MKTPSFFLSLALGVVGFCDTAYAQTLPNPVPTDVPPTFLVAAQSGNLSISMKGSEAFITYEANSNYINTITYPGLVTGSFGTIESGDVDAANGLVVYADWLSEDPDPSRIVVWNDSQSETKGKGTAARESQTATDGTWAAWVSHDLVTGEYFVDFYQPFGGSLHSIRRPGVKRNPTISDGILVFEAVPPGSSTSELVVWDLVGNTELGTYVPPPNTSYERPHLLGTTLAFETIVHHAAGGASTTATVADVVDVISGGPVTTQSLMPTTVTCSGSYQPRVGGSGDVVLFWAADCVNAGDGHLFVGKLRALGTRYWTLADLQDQPFGWSSSAIWYDIVDDKVAFQVKGRDLYFADLRAPLL